MRKNLLTIILLIPFCLPLTAQPADIYTDSLKKTENNLITDLTETFESGKFEELLETVDDYQHRFDILEKQIDDMLWFERLGDVAFIDKVRLTSTPRWKPKDPDDRFTDNKLQFYTYIFIPKDINRHNKYPLIVLPHSGIHANFSTYYYHIVREFISQGYIVVSAEYRGSTGYGKTTYENIDYGGRENDDVLESRNYMIENYDIVDSTRVGVVGWSHGGMISLMQILQYGDKYQCAFAGVPVSDLENRLASHDKSYKDYFTAPYHIGESIEENPKEYIRRSPTYYAKNLNKPLLIYTNTNDNDVYVEEVKLMIETLKIYDKKFEYKIFQNASGGHGFDRIDTKEATDIRYSIHKFLERYLNPQKPFLSKQEMRKAAYGF
ncbi:MAG: prolyl oligopeptidase family serine peptidase [Fermentimonas sp.]|jgi:dipeptidyl aminopeptidase/acylaminoacyl peptidase|nr:prolyl oligopeptidase family serine peptidase [Fermentimonas sp.]MDD3189553.1 prolyl oligopeptidase family serine peptidase [Fermentimonas sp.]MDD3510896.1 prolyl oligopeptidase family serine peptidase [Fermentimonas sp.]MDD4284014.1 prolyl oligopeptidase family serine peptidase [Fermentimonas sp.]MDD4723840.1 prolyl oligopeptidase family serine peptidase [Fermentimonas sp.]